MIECQNMSEQKIYHYYGSYLLPDDEAETMPELIQKQRFFLSWQHCPLDLLLAPAVFFPQGFGYDEHQQAWTQIGPAISLTTDVCGFLLFLCWCIVAKWFLHLSYGIPVYPVV